jgi:hypothetical protein
MTLLSTAPPGARLPAFDLDRARRFYRETLDLEPVIVGEDSLIYSVGGSNFVIYRSGSPLYRDCTELGCAVDDIRTAVAELKARGLSFSHMQPSTMEDEDVHEFTMTAPGGTELWIRSAWFEDTEQNTVGLVEVSS